MRNILVTTDLSRQSQAAFPIAKQMASALSCKLHLLAVKENLLQTAMIHSMDFPICPDPEIEKQMHDKLGTQINELRGSEFQGINLETHLLEAKGPIHSEIAQFAQQHNVDLIIMASHGRSGITRFLIGSVTERLLREAPCPVLVVPAKASAS